RPGRARGVRRLPGGTEPRPSDGRHGALRLAARGLRLRQAHERDRRPAGDARPARPRGGAARPSRRARRARTRRRAAAGGETAAVGGTGPRSRERSSLMAVRARRAPARHGGRTATVSRGTSETDIRVTLNLDGRGTFEVETGVPFLNHMLEIFARHGFFDLNVK